MTMSPFAVVLQTTGQILLWLIALVSWWFVARYAMRAWWRTEEGRHLMTFTAVFALLFTLRALYPYLKVSLEVLYMIQVVALSLALCVIVWRHFLLTHADEEQDST